MATKNAATTVLVPIHREKSGHITVIARLSGKPARFVVDTGAGGTCIHGGYLEKYKLGLMTKTKKGGGVGSSTMRVMTVAVHDLSGLYAVSCGTRQPYLTAATALNG